jgi:hypothetical protein
MGYSVGGQAAGFVFSRKSIYFVTLCAYCDQIIGVKFRNNTKPHIEAPMISHGMCTNCFKVAMSELDREPVQRSI